MENLVYTQLKNPHIFYRFVDSLVDIYRKVDSQKVKLSRNLGPLVVFGEILYFLIYREAKRFNLLSSLSEELRDAFWKFRTTDIDIQSVFSNWYDEMYEFNEDMDTVEYNFKTIMMGIDTSTLFSIVGPVDIKSIITENANGTFQNRLQLVVSDEPVFDIVLRANFEKPETVKFRFTTIKDGDLICENPIEIITRQLYPTEGFWAYIDTKTLEPVDIYRNLACRLSQNKKDATEFHQGFVYVQMMRYIFKQSLEHSVAHIADVFIPPNKLLLSKTFFFQGTLLQKLCSRSLIEKASNLYKRVRQSRQERASPQHTLEFIDLCLQMWKEFAKNIKQQQRTDKCKYIVHFTSSAAFKSIRSSGWLLIQPERYSRDLFFHFEGSGRGSRRIGPNDLTIEQQKQDIYDEGLGVYFRILPEKPARKSGVVAIVFSPDILTKYTDWFINTEENFGFKLGNKLVEAPFSGETGRTVYDINSPEISDRSELVIPHSVKLSDAVEIIE